MGSLGENDVMESTLNSLDPVFNELNRLENSLREKERELAGAQNEIKALKMSQVLKDKAVNEMSNELKKVEEKLSITEKHLEFKVSLEIKKLSNSKKEAMAAQFAAEATLRRLHASQKDEELVPLEAVIAPLESDIKIYKNEIIKLQEDNKALERLTKSKEEALIEAEEILRSALERVLIVEQVQNQNLELQRKIEIFQARNGLMHLLIFYHFIQFI
ncbi:putative microtubule-associated protein [Dioscorea sansibarensis]